jgi:hypothetical protein
VKASNARAITSLMFIKTKDLPLDASRPLHSQIQVTTVIPDSQSEENNDGKSSTYLQNLQQFTRHFLAPIARSIRQSNNTVSAHIHNIFILQRSIS